MKTKIILISTTLLLFISILSLSLYQVGIGESAVVYRFGQIVNITQTAGLKFKLPFDNIKRYSPKKLVRLEVGFRSNLSKKDFSDRNTSPQLWELKHVSVEKNLEESLIITRDENIVDLNCVIHFNIKDLKKFIVHISQPYVLLINVVQSSLQKLIGKETLETILVENKFELQKSIEENIQTQLDSLSSGIAIQKVNLLDIHPPVEVVHSFRDVTSAREDKNTKIYQAMQYKESNIPKAHAEAFKMIQQAQAHAQKQILTSQGDRDRFLPLRPLHKRYRRQIFSKQFYDYIRSTYNKGKLYIVSENLFKDIEFFREQKNSNQQYDNVSYP